MQVTRDHGRSILVNIKTTTSAAALMASFIVLQAVPAAAQGYGRPDRYEDRYEDRYDRRDNRDDRRNDRRDRREDRWDRRDTRFGAAGAYWDPARYYRADDRRYQPRRLGRNDRIYRGSDNRYYCGRDDGTTGLIIGGVTGGVLGNVIARGGSKTIATILGAGLGAVIGRSYDEGDIVCR